jgi:hypothetical protein
VYDIHTLDYDKGVTNSTKCYEFIKEFYRCCVDSNQLPEKNTAFSIRNTALFRKNDQLYIIYANEYSDYEFSYAYLREPLFDELKDSVDYVTDELWSIKNNRNIGKSQLAHTMDMRLFIDWREDLKNSYKTKDKFDKFFNLMLMPTTNWKSKIVEMFDEIELAKTSITYSSCVEYDALGIGSILSRAFSGDGVKKITKYEISMTSLMKDFLTMYGGPHQYFEYPPVLKITEDSWME